MPATKSKKERSGIANIQTIPILFHLRDVIDHTERDRDFDPRPLLMCMFGKKGMWKVLELSDWHKTRALKGDQTEEHLAGFLENAFSSGAIKAKDVPKDAFRCDEVEITTSYYDND